MVGRDPVLDAIWLLSCIRIEGERCPNESSCYGAAVEVKCSYDFGWPSRIPLPGRFASNQNLLLVLGHIGATICVPCAIESNLADIIILPWGENWPVFARGPKKLVFLC
jgi:hypothetical protein